MTKEDTLLLDKNINTLNKPKMLLQACCGPCSTAVLERLVNLFDIMVLYYNPNTWPEIEYLKRMDNLKEVLKHYPNVKYLDLPYDHNEFINTIKGLENEKEGGSRCTLCFKLRLSKTAKLAKELGYDIFTTTLSISPYKDSDRLNEIGNELEKELGIKYYYSNFKKLDGYKRSIELSKLWNLYRQEYCGCEFSIKDAIKEEED